MKIRVKLLFLGVAAAILSFAAAPVARVISAEPVNVDGILGPARNFMPLSLGAEVTTEGASAVIQFTDGTAVTLQPHSKLRVEGEPSAPVGRVLRGSAIYDVPRTQSGGPATRAIRTTVSLQPAVGQPPVSAGYQYRSPAVRQPGVNAPQAPAFIGSFSRGGNAAGTAAGPQIFGPNGLTLNLTAVVNPSTGATTYMVSSIQQTISTPGGGTALVTVTSGSLIGASVGGITSPAAGTSATFTFTPSGSTTPMTPQQVATAVQTGVQQAINNGVSNGTLPSGVQPPPPMPVTTTPFSASGG